MSLIPNISILYGIFNCKALPPCTPQSPSPMPELPICANGETSVRLAAESFFVRLAELGQLLAAGDKILFDALKLLRILNHSANGITEMFRDFPCTLDR